MNFLYLFLVFFTVSCQSRLLSAELEAAKSQHPCATRILQAIDDPCNDQNAVPRKKKMRPSDPFSPGQCNDGIKKERAALQSFYLYMQQHIDGADTTGWTPLNPVTVTRAAIQRILIGEGLHYETIGFFPHKTTGQEHAILQVVIDLSLKDSKGRTNRMRMNLGKPPIGPDGKRMNLHHVSQDENGILMELSRSTHNRWYRYLHHNIAPGSSKVNRSQFSTLRSHYWKWRIKTLEETEAQDALIRRKMTLVHKAMMTDSESSDAASEAPPKSPRKKLKARRRYPLKMRS